MEFEEYHKYQIEFAKAISNPEYRKFCNDYKLDFYFWDDLSEDQFDPKIANEEEELQWKARGLFNRTKEKYTFYNNQIVDYDIDIHSGMPSFHILGVEGLIYKYQELETKHEETKDLYGYSIALSPYLYFGWSIVLYFYFTWLNIHTHYLIDLLMLVIPIIIVINLPKYILKRKKIKKDRNFINEINSELEFIRYKLRCKE